jgi:hypothetical protein
VSQAGLNSLQIITRLIAVYGCHAKVVFIDTRLSNVMLARHVPNTASNCLSCIVEKYLWRTLTKVPPIRMQHIIVSVKAGLRI